MLQASLERLKVPYIFLASGCSPASRADVKRPSRAAQDMVGPSRGLLTAVMLALATSASGAKSAARWTKELAAAVLSDKQAEEDFPYLRRKPECGGKKADAIPTKLHQIWWQGAEELPEHFTAMRKSWLDRHPRWSHKLWDEVSIGELVNSSFPLFAPTYHALPSKIQKADAARYAILHAKGGVYADLDVESVAAFDPTLNQVRALLPGTTQCVAKLPAELRLSPFLSVAGVASIAAVVRGAR